jgi:hypothetical protein
MFKVHAKKPIISRLVRNNVAADANIFAQG